MDTFQDFHNLIKDNEALDNLDQDGLKKLENDSRDQIVLCGGQVETAYKYVKEKGNDYLTGYLEASFKIIGLVYLELGLSEYAIEGCEIGKVARYYVTIYYKAENIRDEAIDHMNKVLDKENENEEGLSTEDN